MMQWGPGFFATFLYYFSSTGLVFAMIAIAGTGASFSSGIPQEMGLAGGLLGGLVGAYFNRTITLTLPAQNQKTFLKQLEAALTKMGYESAGEADGLRVYQRQGLSRFMSGRIFLQFEDGNAILASRAVQIRTLKKRLK